MFEPAGETRPFRILTSNTILDTGVKATTMPLKAGARDGRDESAGVSKIEIICGD
jgi:hypothetical protein